MLLDLQAAQGSLFSICLHCISPAGSIIGSMAHREELNIFVIISNDHNDLGFAMYAIPETSKAARDVCLACPERLPHIPFPLYVLGFGTTLLVFYPVLYYCEMDGHRMD